MSTKRAVEKTDEATSTLPAEASAAFTSAMQEDAGAGISTRPEDNIVPQLKILQPLSPEVMDGPEMVRDARAGDFLAGDELIKGSEGLWFQPCHVEHKLFEFMPLESGGGFVAEHPVPRDSEGRPRFSDAGDPEPLPKGCTKVERFRYEFANGNQLIHYRQLAGMLWKGSVFKPFVVSFKSTGHTTMREWMFKAANSNPIEVPSADPAMPPQMRSRALFAHLYQLRTLARSNAKGRWFSLEVGHPVCLDPSVDRSILEVVRDPVRVYMTGRALSRAFVSGEKAASLPERVEPEAEVQRRGDGARTVDDEIPF